MIPEDMSKLHSSHVFEEKRITHWVGEVSEHSIHIFIYTIPPSLLSLCIIIERWSDTYDTNLYLNNT